VGAIRVGITVEASRRATWRHLEDIASHPRWMHDAVAVRFRGAQRQGVGTTFDCDTRIGPFQLVDRMTITEWEPRRRMGVRHEGVVTGTGRFTLRALPGGRTRVVWRERLAFPWWMGGAVGGAVGGEVLRLVWARNLRQLKVLVET
jgi:hypothetical protein